MSIEVILNGLADIFVFLMIAGGLIGVCLFFYFRGRYIPKVPPPKPNTIRIACVGDSVTFGAMVKIRRKNCYPAKLQEMLGDKYSVGNFGANSHTVQKTGDFSYWNHIYFKKSAEYEPNIVLLMLGSNDSKHHNFTDVDAYIADYKEIVTYYLNLDCKPKLCILTSPCAYSLKEGAKVNYDISNDNINLMVTALKALAQELNLPVIDINKLTSTHKDWFTFDGVHPDAQGANAIAREVYYTLINNQSQNQTKSA